MTGSRFDAEEGANVTGTVRLKLYKGNIITAGRKSKLSLYRARHRDDGERREHLQPGRRHRLHRASTPKADSRKLSEFGVNALRLRVKAMVERQAWKKA